ncbi:MAG: hypothetical protein ACFB5Z_13520 [Elainellaceae cyanobacterium]
MDHNFSEHRYRAIRLNRYGYSSPGAYFITICTDQAQCLFCDVIEGKIRLNELGQAIAQEWIQSAKNWQDIECDDWMIMPNYIYGIVHVRYLDRLVYEIDQKSPFSQIDVGPSLSGEGLNLQTKVNITPVPKPDSLSPFIADFKAVTSEKINIMRGTHGRSIWQPDYCDRIIRIDTALQRVRDYIRASSRQ